MIWVLELVTMPLVVLDLVLEISKTSQRIWSRWPCWTATPQAGLLMVALPMVRSGIAAVVLLVFIFA